MHVVKPDTAEDFTAYITTEILLPPATAAHRAMLVTVGADLVLYLLHRPGPLDVC